MAKRVSKKKKVVRKAAGKPKLTIKDRRTLKSLRTVADGPRHLRRRLRPLDARHHVRDRAVALSLDVVVIGAPQPGVLRRVLAALASRHGVLQLVHPASAQSSRHGSAQPDQSSRAS